MIYAFAQLTITDPAKLDAYRPKAADALAKHGGAVVQASKDLTVLDGAPHVPDTAALLSFPDVESALAWANDPTLADIHDLRRSAGASDIYVLG